MTALILEHPLNEKLRNYLRLEYLLIQLEQLMTVDTEWQQQAFFTVLFDLTDVLERNDIRPDLIKDCERCETALVKWANHPSVSDDKLQTMLQQTVKLHSDLLRSNKFASAIKEDKFLAPLQQRFALPAAACYFDVPQLQFWFNLPVEQRQQAATRWYSDFALLRQALQVLLQFSRAKAEFTPLMAENGFYQHNTEQYELLRIRYDTEYGVYPTVSGNKYRFAIRFMQLCSDNGRLNVADNISFALACC